MKLYRPYTLIPSSRLNEDYDEKDIRIDWICYLRDHPLLPFGELIEKYAELKASGENIRWIIERANNFLSEAEVAELSHYLEQRYGFSVEIESFETPLNLRKLPWFKENHVNAAIICRDPGDPFCLSLSILGMVAPIKDIDSVRTVNEFLEEIDKQNGN
ncbi:MAG: hypothetical protein O3A78_09710 [Nitrospinae bacterium]|jgi:hypothetical protein|nr:hypothetical protein [Nitrospinota bacterium]MDA1110068.1 hypothetical protein [Nitrospinota bacterium]